jgi:hypothetical protein
MTPEPESSEKQCLRLRFRVQRALLSRGRASSGTQIRPEAPVLVLKAVRLGGAASVAGLLRGLDADVMLAGMIGDDATPRRLLTAIRPDILVKGGTTAEIVGREVVEGYGGRIERTSEIPGHSTTELLTQIQSSEPRPSGSGFRIPQPKPTFSRRTNPSEEPVADARGSDLVPEGSSIVLPRGTP